MLGRPRKKFQQKGFLKDVSVSTIDVYFGQNKEEKFRPTKS